MITFFATGEWTTEQLQQLQGTIGHRVLHKGKRKRGRPTQDALLLQLPSEIRLLIYEQLFKDNPADGSKPVIAPKAQPRTTNATSLLFVCRQIHYEAKPVMLQHATLTMNLHPRYFHCEIDWPFYSKYPQYAELSIGGNVHSFKNIHLHLDGARSARTDVPHWASMPWPEIDTILRTFTIHQEDGKGIHNLTATVNLGDITTSSLVDDCFADWATTAQNLAIGWCWGVFEEWLSAEHKKWHAATSAAHRLRWDEGSAESYGHANLVWCLGEIAMRNGQVLRLENSTRTESLVLDGDHLVDVLKTAQALVGDEDRDIWLVLEGRTKEGEAEAERKKPMRIKQARKEAAMLEQIYDD